MVENDNNSPKNQMAFFVQGSIYCMDLILMDGMDLEASQIP